MFVRDVVKSNCTHSASIMENLVVGACTKTKQIQLGGYLWDIVSYNDGVQHGLISTPKSSAVLLLSAESASKFMNNEYIQFGNNTHYYDSQVNVELKKFQAQFSKLEPEVEIVERSFGESKLTTDGSIAGQNVVGAYFWIPSLEEAQKLKNHSRVYPHSWWLRAPPDQVTFMPHKCSATGSLTNLAG